MRRKIGLIVSIILIMSLLIGIMVACSDDTNNDNTDIGGDNTDVDNNGVNNDTNDNTDVDKPNNNQECVTHNLDDNCVCGACKKTIHAVDGVCRHGDYVYFGSYPQTIKADNVTVTDTTNDKGYYLGADSEWYAKVTASPYGAGYTFSTGTKVTNGEVYYFKVEPIRWRILSKENGQAFILCDSIIDNHIYDDDINNYANSKIRAWLNENFYKIAFSTLQQELILTTTVDNSVASTGYNINQYACENTNDKVFLLSYVEITNGIYGFSSLSTDYDEIRRMNTSDYGRAIGAYMDTNSSYYGNGWWWLRSPHYYGSSYASNVISSGHVESYYNVNCTENGIVPAMWIELE